MSAGSDRSTSRARAFFSRSAPVVAALALAACGEKGAGGRERIVVAAVRQPATALFFVAQASGCLADERLLVEERTFELGRDALGLMRQGGADVAIAFETPTLRAAFQDDRLRVLTTLHGSTRNTRLVARRDRGIVAFADVGGARVGLAQGTNAEFFLDLVLGFGGVPRSRVNVVDLQPEASVGALARGELDAAVLSDPYAARAEKALADGGRTLRTEIYTEVSLLLTREDVLAARPATLRRFVRALACAERVALERPEEAVERIRSRFPELADDELRAQVARVEWRLGLDHVTVGVLHDESDWLRDSGTVEGTPPDLAKMIARRALEEAEPDAVMLLPRVHTGP